MEFSWLAVVLTDNDRVRLEKKKKKIRNGKLCLGIR